MAGPPEDAESGDEFAIIARYFAPLATDKAARGLVDDVALIESGGAFAVKTDAIVEGVHFLPDDPLDLVARKALRVNVSDLVSKAATPRYYLLTLIWPDARPAREIEVLARGLADDQARYGMALIGGDTARTPGPLTLSVMMLGASAARAPSRADAIAGDDVWITGTVGDAGLGLDVRRGGLAELSAAQRAYLEQRYRLPEPPIAAVAMIGAYARASCDVSDGLLADAGKIASASRVAIDIEAAAVPLSVAARAWAGMDETRIARMATAGDDYQVLFTAAPNHRDAILADARTAGVAVARIGLTRAGEGARLIGASGPLAPPKAGFAHRLGVLR
jgi:thiamine-monophosphate kinase